VRAYLSSFWLKLLIWTAIGVILVNDGGAILMGYYRVGDEAERTLAYVRRLRGVR